MPLFHREILGIIKQCDDRQRGCRDARAVIDSDTKQRVDSILKCALYSTLPHHKDTRAVIDSDMQQRVDSILKCALHSVPSHVEILGPSFIRTRNSA
ncbi:hypothetical protein J6590_015295 [Homalodisca vitripennis]|nr:hypothetical protein J6590_015295 [Homalodisca vitripennis]